MKALGGADGVQRRVRRAVVALKDAAREASANLPAPEVITAEIVEGLRAAPEQLEHLEAALTRPTHNRAGADSETMGN